MRGLGRGTAAITIVNALLCGKGCAAALTLGCEATIELRRSEPGALGVSRIPPAIDTPLVRASLAAALHAYSPADPMDASLTLLTSVPREKGLKSSSAVGVAIFDAVARALGRQADPSELATRAANVAQHIGLSATGAFDDAFAALAGGIAVTDNGAREVLMTDDAPSEDPVLLWIPSGTHPPSSTLAGRFAGRAAEGEAAIAEALEGRYFDAMARNSAAIESALNYAYGPLRQRILRLGARAAGISGMGPSLAVVVPEDRLADLKALLAPTGGLLLVSRFRAPGAVGDSVPHPGGQP